MMGYHKDGLSKANPLLYSMPNLNFQEIKQENESNYPLKSLVY
jgi:hypothetical protein